MRKSILTIMAILVIGFSFSQNKPDSIVVHSMDFATSTRYSYDIQDVKDHSIETVRLDSVQIAQFLSIKNDIQTKVSSKGTYDLRLVCILYYEDSVNTIGFGNLRGDMTINHVKYEKRNDELLMFCSSVLFNSRIKSSIEKSLNRPKRRCKSRD